MGSPAQVKSAWDFPEWLNSVNDDRELCTFAFNILKDADAVVTQNGRGFDWKFLQTRLLLHGLPSLPRILHIDTKVLAKSNLLLFSNSLKRMASLFTDERKMENDGWELWEKVHAREPEAMKKMAEYCAQDVEATEALFLELRKFATGLPNYNQLTDEICCSNCGSVDLRGNGTRTISTHTYRRMVCVTCGTWNKITQKGKVSVV